MMRKSKVGVQSQAPGFFEAVGSLNAWVPGVGGEVDACVLWDQGARTPEFSPAPQWRLGVKPEG